MTTMTSTRHSSGSGYGSDSGRRCVNYEERDGGSAEGGPQVGAAIGEVGQRMQVRRRKCDLVGNQEV